MPELTIDCLSTVASLNSGIGTVQCVFPGREIKVRELIALAVREQCAQLTARYATDLAEAACRLARQYLTTAEIGDQAAGGRVASPAARAPSRKGLDAKRETATAFEGFEKGAYIVLVGEHRCTSLDETVQLSLTQPVRFIRMMPLAGG